MRVEQERFVWKMPGQPPRYRFGWARLRHEPMSFRWRLSRLREELTDRVSTGHFSTRLLSLTILIPRNKHADNGDNAALRWRGASDVARDRHELTNTERRLPYSGNQLACQRDGISALQQNSWSSTWLPPKQRWVSCRHIRISCLKGSLTTAAACSWCCIRRSAAVLIGPGAWPCANVSAANSISNYKQPPPKMQSFCPSVLPTVFRSKTYSTT